MKTTNKILLGALVALLLFVTYLIIKIGSYIELDIPEASGVTETVECQVAPFERLVVNKGIDLTLVQDSVESLIVEADTAFVKYFEQYADGDLLRLTVSRNLPDNHKVKAELRTKSLDMLKVNGGAKLVTKNKYVDDTLNIDANSGARVSMDVELGYLKCESTSGAVLNLAGSAERVRATATSGGRLKAAELEVVDAKAHSNSGGYIYLHISGSLDVKATSGGVIEYSGQPQMTNMEVNSGGRLNKKK